MLDNARARDLPWAVFPFGRPFKNLLADGLLLNRRSDEKQNRVERLRSAGSAANTPARVARDGRAGGREWFDYAAERVPRMRLEQLMQKRGLKLGSAVPTADRVTAEEGVQRPRTFYRRELEAQPLVVAKP